MRKSMLFLYILGLTLIGLLTAGRPHQPETKTVVFFGDSITNRGLRSGGYIDLIRRELDQRTRGGKYTLIGAGHEGNTVLNLRDRVDRDVIARHPDLVFIYIGINDVWKVINNPPANTPLNQYEAGLKEIIGKIQLAGAKVVLCTPSVIGEKRAGENPQDALLNQYAGVSRAVARETGAELCDLRRAFQKHLRRHNPGNQEKDVLTLDRVHLNGRGNELVARQFLKFLH